ncbi:MAG TPA: TIGR02530 family flagellar biosynthesis protein [Syntrophomonadaceae bacterium]|nr:TIGR02530 family flagellar biosynthesis protein [Syntrophomonadaceae bacterium]
MTDKIFFPQSVPTSIQPQKPTTGSKTASTDFGKILDKKLNSELKFSGHAQQRLQSRNISLSADEVNKIKEAVGKAREKGSRDSLILMNDLALVVSVKNNTVITAVDGGSLKDNVFTNIDSAVIV